MVEVFTATHLNKIVGDLSSSYADCILTADSVAKYMKVALSSEDDKLPVLSCMKIETKLDKFNKKAAEVIGKTPEFSSIIDYLRDNPEVSEWVERGLPLHEESGKCEFCGNELDAERMAQLKAHFSDDLKKYKSELTDLIDMSERLKVARDQKSALEFYPQLRDQVRELIDSFELAIDNYNSQIGLIVSALRDKLASPFVTISAAVINLAYEQSIFEIVERFNELILRNNDVTTNFAKEKLDAISVLKKHYVANYLTDNDIENRFKRVDLYKLHQERYHQFADKLKFENSELEARISLAHKGREEINKYISGFLGRNEIQIEVVNEGASERFRLIRDGKVAKNLSEGEKTAIAFSFFLTKLQEISNLNEAIVYIDDPISSLDSNHIFQVNAVIRDFFFYKDEESNGEWKSNCRQLFISTHNFEFFSLLKELPLSKNKSRYYFVKRVDSDRSTFCNLPKSLKAYPSEYHYLFSVIYKFNQSADKDDLEILLSIPNAVRRFVELYTYSRIPNSSGSTVDQRAEVLFGSAESRRILKVLHYFSHLNNIERLSNNSDLVCDIENAVTEIIEHLKKDQLHYSALEESLQ